MIYGFVFHSATPAIRRMYLLRDRSGFKSALERRSAHFSGELTADLLRVSRQIYHESSGFLHSRCLVLQIRYVPKQNPAPNYLESSTIQDIASCFATVRHVRVRPWVPFLRPTGEVILDRRMRTVQRLITNSLLGCLFPGLQTVTSMESLEAVVDLSGCSPDDDQRKYIRRTYGAFVTQVPETVNVTFKIHEAFYEEGRYDSFNSLIDEVLRNERARHVGQMTLQPSYIA